MLYYKHKQLKPLKQGEVMEQIIFDEKESKFKYVSSKFWRGGWVTKFCLKTIEFHVYGNYDSLTKTEKTFIKPEIKKITSQFNWSMPTKIFI
jgi:hypothetical protein